MSTQMASYRFRATLAEPAAPVLTLSERSPSSCTIGWDAERLEVLKHLWKNGWSAKQIAHRLGGTTRNAILGKLHRLGLSGTVSKKQLYMTSIDKRPERKLTRKIKLTPRPKQGLRRSSLTGVTMCTSPGDVKLPYVSAAEELIVPFAERKGVLELQANDCRWPIGDPRMEDFHFCNGRKMSGYSYCEHHVQKSVAPAYRVEPHFNAEPRKAGPEELAVAVRSNAA